MQMPEIKIKIRDKRAGGTGTVICGNSDYTVVWDLDQEWAFYDAKTMRVLFVAREAFLARRDIYEDLGHRGGRGRPHHRRAHPQTAPEDRRRTHRHHQGRGLQIRTLSRAIPGE